MRPRCAREEGLYPRSQHGHPLEMGAGRADHGNSPVLSGDQILMKNSQQAAIAIDIYLAAFLSTFPPPCNWLMTLGGALLALAAFYLFRNKELKDAE